ncbi:MAG: hypothetical protein E7439_04590 [Ruminococcaceae bacterium]|nr:hypothetical protein [Oscillospiraceae bacterium]
MTKKHLRVWGFFCVALGIVSQCLIRGGILKLRGMSSPELLELMERSPESMLWITISLALQALESCAIPIFAFLLVKGFCEAENVRKYFCRIVAVAVASEIPYNLAFSGVLLDPGSRNPAFALALGAGMLWLWRYFSGNNGFIKVAIALAAVLWCGMLGIVHGPFVIAMTAVIWFSQGKAYATLLSCGAAALGAALSPFYLAAPLGVAAVHFYREEEGNPVSLLCYPLFLLAGFAATLL